MGRATKEGMRLLLLSWAWMASAHAGTTDRVWVQLPDAPAVAEARALGLHFTEEQDGDWTSFAVTPEQREALDASALQWRWDARPPPPPSLPAGYRSAAEMVAALDALADEAPQLVERVDLGWSAAGLPIAAVRIGAAAAPASWRILGAHHGDELPSGELALAIATDLIDAYGTDPDLTALLDTSGVWVVPHVNPDGHQAVRRTNANGVDLNRNYDYRWVESGTRHGAAPFSEPESRAIRSLSAHEGLIAGLSIHAGAANLGWVWNHTLDDAPDAPLARALAERYADRCDVAGFWITNGAAWYPTNGDTNDWSYGRHGVLDFTLEVSVDKQPPAEALPALLAAHLPAVHAWWGATPTWTGVVTDAETGLPIPASVQVDDSPPLSAGWGGGFGRIASDGAGLATVSAAGFGPQQVALDPTGPARVVLERRPELRTDQASLLVSFGSDGCLDPDLVGATTTLRLTRPGHDAVVAEDAPCGWQLPLDLLAPGPWDLHTDDGVLPRGLLMGEVDATVRADRVISDGTFLTIEGQGFGVGTRAWALVTDARLPLSVPADRVSDGSLRVDLGDALEYQDEDAAVDLIIVSSGAQISVLDALQGAEVDTDAPPRGTPADPDGPSPGGDRPPPQRSGCEATAGQPLAAATVLSLFLLALFRRKST